MSTFCDAGCSRGCRRTRRRATTTTAASSACRVPLHDDGSFESYWKIVSAGGACVSARRSSVCSCRCGRSSPSRSAGCRPAVDRVAVRPIEEHADAAAHDHAAGCRSGRRRRRSAARARASARCSCPSTMPSPAWTMPLVGSPVLGTSWPMASAACRPERAGRSRGFSAWRLLPGTDWRR